MAASTDISRAVTAPRPVTPLALLAARLEALSERVRTLPQVDPAVLAELRAVTALASGLDPYVTACTTPESRDLAELARATQAEDWSSHTGVALEQEMLSGHVEGQFLKLLVHATRARRVLELGLFTGYSALAMAEALPAGGELIACELDPSAAAFAARHLAVSASGAKVAIRVGPALESLEALAADGARFELVFVDADKAGYVEYVQAVLDGDLLAPHGVICVDNTLMQGEPYLPGAPTANGAAIAAFNRAVAEDPRVEQVLVPLRDGLTLIRLVR